MARNCHIRFMDNNYLTDAGVTATASSAGGTNPYANAINPIRTKTWTQTGVFTIDATNNLLYINDGSDLTATIASADYSASSLATAATTALNAVSSGWTVSYSTSTLKFTISRSSAATLRFSEQTTAAWDDMGFTDMSDDASGPWEAEDVRIHTHESVVWDLGGPLPVSFFGCIGPVDETFPISDEATITLKGNNINDFTSPPTSETLTRDENGIFHFLDTATAETITQRFWEFKWVDRRNTAGATSFNLGYLYLGDYVTLTSSNLANGFRKTLIDQSTRVESESGARYFNSRPLIWDFSSSVIQLPTEADRLTLEQMFYDLGRTEAFFVSLDPTLAFSTNQSDLTKFVRFENNTVFDHVIFNYYNISFAMREVV